MSEATELARAEADRVEAEEAETQTEPEPLTDLPPEPELEPELPPVDSVKMAKALDKEGIRHEDALKKVMGEDFEMFERCALCAASVAGYVLPFEALPEDARNEIREGVNQYVAGGGIDLERFDQAADMAECEVCHGEGMVRSGSKHPDHILEVCNPCRGNGWRTKPVEAPPLTQLPAPPAAQPVPPAPPYLDAYGNPSWIGPDAAGRPHGAPDYGMPVPTQNAGA